MPLPKSDIGIARNIRMIEWLKAELVGAVGNLLRNMVQGAEEGILDALAQIVMTTFVLAKRLGFSFSALEAKVENKIEANVEQSHEIEEWFGDFSALRRYLEESRGDGR